MAGRDIKVRFEGDATDLVKASNQAERAVNDVAEGKGGKGGLSGLAGGLGALGGPATLAAGALVGVGMAAWDMASAAMEDQKSAALLAQNLRSAAGASNEAVEGAEDFISALSMQAAIADDELRPALASLARGTGDTALAQERLKLATDIAAGSGKDLNTVAEAMMKAEQGNIGALGRLGIETKNAAGETMTLEEVLAGAATQFKGASDAAAGTAEGGLARAGIAFGEMKEQIGSAFLPAIAEVGRVFAEVLMPAFQQLVAWVQENWPAIYAEYIEPVMTSIKDLINEVVVLVMEIWRQWGDEILAATKLYFGTLADYIKFILNVITGIIRFVTALLKGDWEGAWEAVKGIVSSGIDYVAKLFERLGPLIIDAMKGLASLITAPFRSAFNTIADLWNKTIGSLEFTFPDWIPGFGGKTIAVPDIPTWNAPFGMAAMAGVTVVMPQGSDGYDVARVLSSYQRNAGGLAGATPALV